MSRVTQGPHDHVITFGVTTGTLWLQVLLVAAALTVAACALVRPFFAEQERVARVAVAWAAAVAGVLTLLLTDGLDLPRQFAVLFLAGLGVPLFLARHTEPPATAPLRVVHHLTPWVLLAAATGASVEFARAWLGAGSDRAGVLLNTGLVIAMVGLSWFAVWRPAPGRAKALVNTVGWALASAVVAGTAHVATLTVAAG
ncbi:DUF6239 family natural product biosynthesis protein [Amycolatopsis sp. 195334CR]|uniref:DUF6239 family natural product biosynthesis protein n=1 Tax=Amycolatopsis sp. 195334CR TaxID=2814588 RepID=UPI001A8E23C1|nr:DUF6239 family natural product biosynthesis protein [Amycolatopsis sp. 195334CR]MBN6036965.1 hypothetical protein [Amycolatopsis sp. 195334CR]